MGFDAAHAARRRSRGTHRALTRQPRAAERARPVRYNNAMTRRRWVVAAGGAVARRPGGGRRLRPLGSAGGRGRPRLDDGRVRDDRRSLSDAPRAVDDDQDRARRRHRSRRSRGATYGFDDRRSRFATGIELRPPFRRLWTFRGRALLEFPPRWRYGRLYLPTFDGRFYALDARTGKTIWSRRTQRCGWASPAVLGSGSCTSRSSADARRATTRVPGEDGIVVAYAADSGKIVWQRTTGLNESSPLVAGGLVYVADWDGIVWALDARTGRTRWTFRTGGRIKGSLALAGGRVFVGDYDGRVYALDARTGRFAWRASSQPRLGGRGAFYSTPAVALRARLHRQHRRQGLRIRRGQRTAALVAEHRRLRLRLACRLAPPRSSSARTTTRSTPSTLRRVTCAGDSERTGRSRDRRP